MVPWTPLCEVIEPLNPKASPESGRPPLPLERTLRVYFLQQWLNLSDLAVEEALYDSAAMRAFARIDLCREGAPDEKTMCKFRRLLERLKLGKPQLATVKEHRKRNGIRISHGTIGDTTIISAPNSTKNRDGEWDPEMHQTAKGQQCYFGMKAHAAVDSRHKLFRNVLVSAANVVDRDARPYLPHGQETRVWGDQGCQGQTAVIRRCVPAAQDCTNRRYRQGGQVDATIKATSREKSRVRAKVEHSISVLKRVFGFQKVRYRGPVKNLHRLKVTAARANLFMVERQLLRFRG